MLIVICVLLVSDVLNVSHVSFVPYVPNLMCIFFYVMSPYACDHAMVVGNMSPVNIK